MDKGDDIFTEFLGSNVDVDEVDGNWVDSLYESINNQSHSANDVYEDVSKQKMKQLEREGVEDNEAQSNGSYTIPVDSPSMHMFVHSDDDDDIDHQPDSAKIIESIPSSNTSLSTKPPTFSQSHINATKSNSIPIHPKPTSDKKSRSLPTSPLNERLIIYQLIRDGLKEYCVSLYNAEPDKSLDNRAEYMSKYLQSNDVNFTARNVSDCFSQIRKDETDLNITNQLGDAALLNEIRALLLESIKRRKSYTRRKGAKPSSKLGLGTKPNLAMVASSTPTTPTNHSSTGSGGIVNIIKIGAFHNQKNLTVDELIIQNLTAIADYSKIVQNHEDERYIHQLRTQSNTLKNCIDDIYGHSLPTINYPMTYSKIPLNISSSMSIDLENDRMISYAEVLLDLSDMICAFDRTASMHNDYTKIIQLKSITRIYDHGTLIYKKCDPVTGFFPSDISNISKIILPLQAKFWAGFINDYHNGIVNQSVFENLKITHTLLPNDDIIKFNTGSAPFYSFIWEFDPIKSDQPSVPISVIITKLEKQFKSFNNIVPLPKQNKQQFQFQRQLAPKRVTSFSQVQSTQDFNTPLGLYKQSNHSMNVLPVQRNMRTHLGSGHKRTRSRSVNEIDFMSEMNIMAHSTFLNNSGTPNDPFTPVSPSIIMSNTNSGFKQPILDCNSFDSFNTPQSQSLVPPSTAPASQASFDLSLSTSNTNSNGYPQLGRFRNVSFSNSGQVYK